MASTPNASDHNEGPLVYTHLLASNGIVVGVSQLDLHVLGIPFVVRFHRATVQLI